MSMEILCFIFWKKVFRAKLLAYSRHEKLHGAHNKVTASLIRRVMSVPHPNLSPQQEGPRWYPQNLSFSH